MFGFRFLNHEGHEGHEEKQTSCRADRSPGQRWRPARAATLRQEFFVCFVYFVVQLFGFGNRRYRSRSCSAWIAYGTSPRIERMPMAAARAPAIVVYVGTWSTSAARRIW